MPSKRKTRTHIFQRSRTRSRRSCSQPKLKALHTDIEEDVTSELEESHEEEITHDEEIQQENIKDADSKHEDCEVQSSEIKEKKNSNEKIGRPETPINNTSQRHVNAALSKKPTNIRNPNKNLFKKSPRRGHTYKSYSHEMLVAAYKCVKDLQMPVKAAARMFGVPSSTLHNRVQGQVQIDDSIISSNDVVKIMERLKNGEGLDEAFSGVGLEKFGVRTKLQAPSEEEDNINDDSLTESIMEKMNVSAALTDSVDIKEEVMDPEYEDQMNGSDMTNGLDQTIESDDSNVFASPVTLQNQVSPSSEQLRRLYKRNYKTYSYEQLVAAYLYVKEKKVAVKFAARAFGVPPSTLNDRVQGKVFIDTSIVMNTPGGRKILPKPNLNRTPKGNENVSYYRIKNWVLVNYQCVNSGDSLTN